MKKLLKIILLILITLLILVAILPLLIQTRLFKDRLAQWVGKTVGNALDAQLLIGSIDGNLYSTLQLSDVRLIADDDTLTVLPRVELGYSFAPLLRKTIQVHSLLLDSPRFYLKQHTDGSWVFKKLGSPSDSTNAPDTTRTSFPFKLKIDDITLRNGSVTVDAQSPLIPRLTQDININIVAALDEERAFVQLNHLSLQSTAPDWMIKHLAFSLQKDSSGVSLRDFALRTADNALDLAAETSLPIAAAAVELETDPLDWREFAAMLPTITVPGSPSLRFHATLVDETLDAEVSLSDAPCGLRLRGQLTPFSALFDSLKETPRFSLNASLDHIAISDWLPGMEPLHVNAEVSVNGSGRNARNAELTAQVSVVDSRYADWRVEALNLDARYRRGNASAIAAMQTPMGRAEVTANVDDLFAEQRFAFAATVAGFDLAKMPVADLPSSQLNFSAHGSGRSFHWKRMQATTVINLDSSRFAGFAVDSLRADFRIEQQEFHISRLFAANSNAELEIAGLFSFDGPSDLRANVRTLDLEPLRQMIAADSIGGSVRLNAHLQGRIDSLRFKGTLDAKHPQFNQVRADSITINFNGGLDDAAPTVRADAQLSALRLDGIKIDTIGLTAGLERQSLALFADVEKSGLARLRFDARYLFGETPTIMLPLIDLQARDQHWRGGSDSTRIILGDGIQIQHFSFDQLNGDSTFASSFAHGTISLSGAEDFTLELSNFDLSLLSEFVPTLPPIRGALSLRARVTGTAQQPVVDLLMDANDAGYHEFAARRLHARARYEKELLMARLAIIPQNDSLTAELGLPVRLSLAEGAAQIIKERPLRLAVDAADLRINDALPRQTLFDVLDATLDLHLESESTLETFKPRGYLRLHDGRILHKGLGFELHDLKLHTTIEPERITLEELSARRNRGTLMLQGFADLTSDLSDPLKALSLRLRAEQLFLSTKPKHELQIQADLTLEGTPAALNAGGELTVLRSSFDTAIFLSQPQRGNDDDVPLLVQALQTAPEATAIDTVIVVTAQKPTPDMLKQLRGNIKVKIPRNTWIRNDNLRMELSGEVDVIKSPQALELFGAVRVLRGQYDFLGRRFKVAEGEVTFQGGEIDPQFNVQADYTFRDTRRDKRVLRLIVSGKASEPQLRFTLDDNTVTEGEAVSFLLFGKSPDELTGTQAEDAQSSLQPGRLATNAVYGLLSAQLANRIGAALDLDMMEIQGQDNLNTATFLVGKYLTPDLFMSYEHSFGALEADRPPRVVTIEYELTRFLFLQLISGDTKSSGVDVVFKWVK